MSGEYRTRVRGGSSETLKPLLTYARVWLDPYTALHFNWRGDVLKVEWSAGTVNYALTLLFELQKRGYFLSWQSEPGMPWSPRISEHERPYEWAMRFDKNDKLRAMYVDLKQQYAQKMKEIFAGARYGQT